MQGIVPVGARVLDAKYSLPSVWDSIFHTAGNEW
jgi:hypothetical protein